jgi:hypothetical protein
MVFEAGNSWMPVVVFSAIRHGRIFDPGVVFGSAGLNCIRGSGGLFSADVIGGFAIGAVGSSIV